MSENVKSYQQRGVEALERIADALENPQKAARKRHNWRSSDVPGFWTCLTCGASTQNTMEAERKAPCL